MGTTIVTCQITNLIKSHVFVKIEGDDRKASIHIGELASKYTSDIFEFEYEGVKLHIGQTLRARVVGIINQQNHIQLSLKNIP
ncbi:MAG: S1 RNA-binding domain-containing protein [Sphingobacteriales bacterium]|nr:S1 RNA-binding domain-containing protein [Sphingobacteriales bacterium]